MAGGLRDTLYAGQGWGDLRHSAPVYPAPFQARAEWSARRRWPSNGTENGRPMAVQWPLNVRMSSGQLAVNWWSTGGQLSVNWWSTGGQLVVN